MEEEKQPTLKDILEKMSKSLDKLNEEKETKKFKFRLPFKARLTKKQARNNWVTIEYINENKEVNHIKAPIVEGVILVDGVPHVPHPGSILSLKGKPYIVQPSWSTQPFIAKEEYDKAKGDGTMSKGWKLILNRYKTEAIAIKKQWGMGTIIIGVLILGGIAWYAFSGGKLF